MNDNIANHDVYANRSKKNYHYSIKISFLHIDLHPSIRNRTINTIIESFTDTFIIDSKETFLAIVKNVLLRKLLILKYLNFQSCENIKSTPLVVLKIYASAVVLSYIFIGQSGALKYRENVQFFYYNLL